MNTGAAISDLLNDVRSQCRTVCIAIMSSGDIGAVSDHARRVAEYLASRGLKVVVLSRDQSNWPNCEHMMVDVPQGAAWKCLERLAIALSSRLPKVLRCLDVSKVIASARFGRDVRQALVRERLWNNRSALVVYQHSTFIGIPDRSNRPATTMISHGDVFSHPRGAFSMPLRWLYSVGARRAYRRADKIVAVSEHLASVASAIRGNRNGVYVIANGVDERFFCSRVNPRASPEKIRVLFVGRLAAEKGVDVLLRSLANLDSSSFELAIVGDGPERAPLEVLARELGVAGCVEFRGHVERQVLVEVYRSADVLVVPSRAEGQGVVVLEAMANGLPVIASRVGGIPEFVEDRVNGFLFPNGDSTALAELLRELQAGNGLMTIVAHRAREDVERYAWDHMLEAIHSVITDDGLNLMPLTAVRGRGNSGLLM